MAIPTLKSNAADQRVCKKMNISWVFGADRKIRPSKSLLSIIRHSLVMPISDPRTDFSTSMEDNYNIMDHMGIQTVRSGSYCVYSYGPIVLFHMTSGLRV